MIGGPPPAHAGPPVWTSAGTQPPAHPNAVPPSGLHLVLHPPQWSLSVAVSTHAPLQFVVPGRQARRQLLPAHTPPSGQTWPHPPQFLGSLAVTMHWPPHDKLYGGQPHLPAMHCSVAGQSPAAVHGLPDPPPRPPPSVPAPPSPRLPLLLLPPLLEVPPSSPPSLPDSTSDGVSFPHAAKKPLAPTTVIPANHHHVCFC